MFIEKITGAIADKKRWWQYKARVKALPPSYRTAAEAVERYLMYFGAAQLVGADGGDWASMFEDLADLFEQAAADQTPIRDIVGDDPEEFVQTFTKNYSDGQWKNRERDRFLSSIERAVGEDAGEEKGSDR